MKNIKIPDGEYAEQTIRIHALGTFGGCRELFYEVATPMFDEIWFRTEAPMWRETSRPRLLLLFGRHQVTVFAEDAVPAGEVKCLTADDATMCEAAPSLDGPAKEGT
jgi:hypothetical protein